MLVASGDPAPLRCHHPRLDRHHRRPPTPLCPQLEVVGEPAVSMARPRSMISMESASAGLSGRHVGQLRDDRPGGPRTPGRYRAPVRRMIASCGPTPTRVVDPKTTGRPPPPPALRHRQQFTSFHPFLHPSISFLCVPSAIRADHLRWSAWPVIIVSLQSIRSVHFLVMLRGWSSWLIRAWHSWASPHRSVSTFATDLLDAVRPPTASS